MITSELIAQSYLKATGEISTLTSTDDDWKKLLAIANLYIDNWANEPGVNWSSLYDPAVDCGRVSASNIFDLDDTIRTISDQPDDYVQITHTDGKVTNYQTTSAANLKRYDYGYYCAKVGRTLIFNHTFTTADPQFGGTITVPAYLYPEHLANATDEVPVDNPNWLIFMCAATWVQTDVTLAQNQPSLIAEANDVMKSMKQANGGQIDTIPMSSVARGRTW